MNVRCLDVRYSKNVPYSRMGLNVGELPHLSATSSEIQSCVTGTARILLDVAFNTLKYFRETEKRGVPFYLTGFPFLSLLYLTLLSTTTSFYTTPTTTTAIASKPLALNYNNLSRVYRKLT